MQNRNENNVQQEQKQAVQTLSYLNVSNENYKNPIIPEGFKRVAGHWNNGFTIKDELERSQFVWVPVGMLDANGTLDGVNFNSQFGRRNYQNDDFSKKEFNEEMTPELFEMCQSIEKYGGFYVARYAISKSSKGKPQSVKGAMPWVHIKYTYAKEVAESMIKTEQVTSHLMYGAEYDTVLEWFIKTDAKTFVEIAEDSTNWGNHVNTEEAPRKVVKTGDRKHWCVNNIYDFAGNTDEWTQEKYSKMGCVLRGGTCNSVGSAFPVSYRDFRAHNDSYANTSFRVALCIK